MDLLQNFNPWLSRLLESLFPRICVLCQADSLTGIDLCRGCQEELPWIDHCCAICSIPLPLQHTVCGQCLQSSPAYQASCIAFQYRYPVAQLNLQFKHQQQLMYGQVLSQLLSQFIDCRIQDSKKPDVLIPVPLHSRRQRQRGFNQAHEIALVLSRNLGLPLMGRAVVRNRHTASQKSLGSQDRAKNLKGCFSLAGSVAGMSVAIVDDVMTTGATVQELASLLRSAGTREVQIWALARTPIQPTHHALL